MSNGNERELGKMKLADIIDGGTYETIVSGKVVAVKVHKFVREERVWSSVRGESKLKMTTKFVCVRLDNGNELPNPRTAAALRVH